MTKRSEPNDDFALDVQAYLEQNPGSEAEIQQEVEFIKIGESLYDLRTKAGLSIEEVAKRAKVTASLVDQVEGGENRRISLGQLIRIAVAVDGSISIKKPK